MTGFNIGYAEITEAWGDLSGKSKKKKKQQDPICDLYEMKGAYSEMDLVNYDKNKYQRMVRDKPIKKSADELDNYESKQLPNSLFEKQFELKHPQNFDMEDPKEYMVRSCEQKNTPTRQDYSQNDLYDQTEQESYEYSKPKPRQSTQEYPEYQKSRQFNQEHPKIKQEYMVSDNESHQEYVYEDKEQYNSDTESEYYVPRRKIKQERRKYYEDSDNEYDYPEIHKKPKKQKFVYLDILLYVLSGIILIFLLEQFVKIGINMQHV